MLRMLTRLLCLAVIAQLMFGCTLLQPLLQPSSPALPDQTSLKNQRAASAELALFELAEIDVLIKLDNQQLARQIAAGLKAQASSSGDFYFRELNIQFGQQLIAVHSSIDISDNAGNVITASATGDVLLDFSGNRLVWFPLFSDLQISSIDFSFADGTYAEAIPELTESILQRLNADVTNSLMLHDNNAIPLEAVPLAEVEAGISLPGIGGSTASHRQPLNGVFVVAGSAMLIETDTTTIALDMNFISDLSSCPADIEVSRAVFARDIESREPVGLARNMSAAENLRYFYSEISGAKRPMTIIHYWFADGQPIVVEELAVGPSERWRTWSSKGTTNTGASHWEVLVVEKESGCILYSQSVRTLSAEGVVSQADKERANQTFSALRNEFNARTFSFSVSHDTPEIALIEIKRSFLQNVFKTSLADLHIEAEFDQGVLSQRTFSAQVLPFDTRDIICTQRNCPEPRSCVASAIHCKRLRDTRDCSSCLFYNPLNNRCVSQAVDPICEAARNRQNAKYEANRAACIDSVAAEKEDCEQSNIQDAQSCEIEFGIEVSDCEDVKAGIEALAVLADVSADSNIEGKLSVVFSRFRIEDDFSRLKLDITLISDLEMKGELEFTPGNIPEPLKMCISAWSTPYASRVNAVASTDSILTNIEVSETALTANWSGFTLPLTMTPSPLEAVFVNKPQLLASCGIGLTIAKVEQAIAGDGANFLTGQLKMEVLPQPTRIRFSPATMTYGTRHYRGEAVLGENYLRYDIGM